MTTTQQARELIQLLTGNQPEPSRWPRIRFGERESIHPMIRRAIFERDGRRCLSCGVQLTLHTAQLDHITPWSAGGSDYSDNLRILCEPCNTDRSNFRGDLDTWIAKRLPVTFECLCCVPSEYPYSTAAYSPFSEDDDELYAPQMPLAYCFQCGIVAPAWEVY